ncbi:MAG: hypothetical protein KKA60_07270 [Proteobacteria bacterium]|nr:hypothetical protein [Pseudomonadota bacterium]
MKPVDIQYGFELADGTRRSFELRLDEENLSLMEEFPEPLPAWTALAYQQCSHCPLDPAEHPSCPLSMRLVRVVGSFDGLQSFDRIRVRVRTAERVVSQETSVQRAVASMVGILFATSGCPHASYFAPMARFHLPFASEAETTYRAASMYLLAQYFLHKQGQEADLSLSGLTAIYQNLEIVNSSVARRLRAASSTDSTVNAVILLDMFAKTLPISIEESLDRIGHLFRPFFPDGKAFPPRGSGAPGPVDPAPPLSEDEP